MKNDHNIYFHYPTSSSILSFMTKRSKSSRLRSRNRETTETINQKVDKKVDELNVALSTWYLYFLTKLLPHQPGKKNKKTPMWTNQNCSHFEREKKGFRHKMKGEIMFQGSLKSCCSRSYWHPQQKSLYIIFKTLLLHNLNPTPTCGFNCITTENSAVRESNRFTFHKKPYNPSFDKTDDKTVILFL